MSPYLGQRSTAGLEPGSKCGTHAIVDAGFWPCHTSERLGAQRLLRSVGPGMLVMWDRGLHSYAMRARARGAHLLARLPANIHPEPIQRLECAASDRRGDQRL